MLVRVAFRSRLLSSSSAALVGIKPALKDLVIDLAKLSELTTPQLDLLWAEYHSPERSANSEVQITGRSLSPAAFQLIKRNAEQSPLFVLPNFRAQGFCTLFTEFSPKTDFVVMTMLDEYRTMGSAATPWLSISLFDHFAHSPAQLVLEQTRYNALQLTRPEAEALTTKWLEAYSLPISHPNTPFVFNHRSAQFDFNEAFGAPTK